jgi:predicted nucleotidyltransferase
MSTPGLNGEPSARQDGLIDRVAERLFALPAVEAVTLGGSRAQGTHRLDSDWDLGIYYRGAFDPRSLRDIGWPGEVSDIGAWGGGVFNGGARLHIDGRRIDVHYRDLDAVEHGRSEAAHGRFRIEPLLFHLAGIPSYLLIAELAISTVLRGTLDQPRAYPAALRASAPKIWWENAELVFSYARANHAPYGRLTQCVGLVAQAASQTAHAILAARGEWITNDKTLLTRAGLAEIDQVTATAQPEPNNLRLVVSQARWLCKKTLLAATDGGAPGIAGSQNRAFR